MTSLRDLATPASPPPPCKGVGKEVLAELLCFLDAPSPSSSGSFTPTSDSQSRDIKSPLFIEETTATSGTFAASPLRQEKKKSKKSKDKKDKKDKKEKKAKKKNRDPENEENDKNVSEKDENNNERGPSPSKKDRAKATGEAADAPKIPDRLLMAALLARERAEWEKELRSPQGPPVAVSNGVASADLATVPKKIKERRLSLTLRRRSFGLGSSAATTSAPTLPAVPAALPQDAFFVEELAKPTQVLAAEQRVYHTLKMSKREARMTWSPEMAAEMIAHNKGSPVKFA